MTTLDHTTPAAVDPLILTAPARAGQRVAALAVDVLVPVAVAAVAALLFRTGVPAAGWILALLTLALVFGTTAALGRSGRTPGRLAAGTRTVERSTGAAAGASVLAKLVSGRLGTYDIHRGRDPFAPALAPFAFPARQPAAVTPARTSLSPVVELDSGQRFPLHGPLVLGRNPSTPADAPAEVYRWADLSRTLSKSHARFEWDGRVVWVTDLGSTNGTFVRTASGAQPLLAHQRTPLPADAALELGDRVVTVRVPA
ncbi:FHA domain-containing protein [Microbacterium sp. BK668]|uniref:FHA domain-containing protein n=1 Tax=Microbacterium sp. BK668 TaxID=2512118 RepID=UPI00105F8515|nr:FHA domain-containing protein [Microbacterium sp. BK668]TDN91333.1 RDD family protein [Microbacterium sp. BK668]